jgi:hypothetical protein
MTKRGFLLALRCELQAAYAGGWVDVPGKLDAFMQSAARAIDFPVSQPGISSANLTDSPCARKAWRSIGGKGNVTYKALRALPHGIPVEVP